MLTTAALLDLWERDPPPAERPLHVLAACDGGDPSRLPVDEVNRRLLEIRGELFGDALGCYAECSRCAAPVEFDVSVEALVHTAPVPSAPLRHGDMTITCRPPTTSDVAAAADAPDTRRALCERCVTAVIDGGDGDHGDHGADHGNNGSPVADLSDDVVAAVEEHLDRQHPLLAVTLAVGCPGCGHGWAEPLDIAAHLWADIDRWARRLLIDVAVLGRAYGWAERDVLAMGHHRRARYLELAG